jgi:hypothetical protein
VWCASSRLCLQVEGSENDHAGTGSGWFSTFKVRNSVLRLIPNMIVSSLTGSPC